MMKNYYLILIFIFFITNCTNKNVFNIQLGDINQYEKINSLINEIYINAINNNVGYFRFYIEKEIIFNIEKYKNDYDYEEIKNNSNKYWTEERIILYTEEIMRQIVISKLNKTYKKRAFYSHDGIIFDYTNENYKNEDIRYFLLINSDPNENIILDSIILVR